MSAVRPKHVRVAFLLGVLALVVFYALHDVLRRRERADWERTLDVALVLVTDGPADAPALDEMRRRVPALATRLREQFSRYRPGAAAPFAFTVYGPVPREWRLRQRPRRLGRCVASCVRLWRFTRHRRARCGTPARLRCALYVVYDLRATAPWWRA